MEFFADYGLFLLKTTTFVVGILITIAGIAAIKHRQKDKGQLTVKKLNNQFEQMTETLNEVILDKKSLKAQHKLEKQHKKECKQQQRRKIFVLNFKGDIKASAVETLREEITGILLVGKPEDEILLKLESAGGMVHAYGLAASQLHRIREKGMQLTIAIDKVAASGGYLMACVGQKILAAPFAIKGSIGVVAQLPNFHRYLQDKHIDFELITAGEYKRTLTVFGENTDKAREKFTQDLNDIHHDFKQHILEHRPIVDVDKVSTGEHWLAKRAKQLNLVDDLITSDDYLLKASQDADLYEVNYQIKPKIPQKLAENMQLLLEKAWASVMQNQQDSKTWF